MGWGARFAGILLTGALLAGCGGGAGPEPRALVAATADPTGQPTTEPTTEPTGEPSAEPSVARESATEFVRRWISLANTAFASGEVGGWAALNAAGCASCAKRVAAVRETYGAGGRIDGGRLEVVSLAAEDGPSVVAELTATPERHLAADGRTRSSADGGPLTLVFYLDRRDGGWRVTEIKLGVPG